jgi:hypothetical protein
MTKLRVGASFLLAAIVASACVSAAWALIGGGTPAATFAVQLDGEPVVTVKGYALDAALTGGDKREYTLRLSLQLTDNAAPLQAFQSGQAFASASISLLAADLRILRTYTLVNATVVAYRQSADAGTNAFDQELVLRSRSLTISGP